MAVVKVLQSCWREWKIDYKSTFKKNEMISTIVFNMQHALLVILPTIRDNIFVNYDVSVATVIIGAKQYERQLKKLIRIEFGSIQAECY